MVLERISTSNAYVDIIYVSIYLLSYNFQVPETYNKVLETFPFDFSQVRSVGETSSNNECGRQMCAYIRRSKPLAAEMQAASSLHLPIKVPRPSSNAAITPPVLVVKLAEREWTSAGLDQRTRAYFRRGSVGVREGRGTATESHE